MFSYCGEGRFRLIFYVLAHKKWILQLVNEPIVSFTPRKIVYQFCSHHYREHEIYNYIYIFDYSNVKSFCLLIISLYFNFIVFAKKNQPSTEDG